MRARHARTEVTGVSLLRQNFLALVKLVSARTLADLKKVSPGDADSLNHSLSDNLYGREKLSIFDREFMTEVEFHALFAGDEAALDRIGVRSVAELMMYVDVTGKPRLGMNRGSRLPRQAQKGCRGKKDEEHLVAFAPFQLAQVRQTVEAWMEQALKDSVRTVTPGSRSLGPNAIASPGLLGSKTVSEPSRPVSKTKTPSKHWCSRAWACTEPHSAPRRWPALPKVSVQP